MRIYLIGFMGCGKTTKGKRLAEKLNYKFIDLDEMMEEAEEAKLNIIFSSKGEEYFRKLEADTLRLTGIYHDTVVSCGGGTPCYHQNMEWIKSHGTSIYLQMPAEYLYGRLKTRKEKRPLIKNMRNAELKDYINANYLSVSNTTCRQIYLQMLLILI